uniref:FAD dependent oxidoreductase domain-containing protein n=1 Tax=Ditylum brightwellii TaxID=49249 RepID=A0A6V2AIS8_9STRA
MTSKALVVGAGAIGLRTALELLRRNVRVVLRSPEHPLHHSTCSMGAGGLWMPFHCDDPRVDSWAASTLDELLLEAKSTDDSAVEIVPTILLKRYHNGPIIENYVVAKGSEGVENSSSKVSPLPSWTSDPRLDFQHLSVEMLSWQNNVHQLRIPSQDDLVNAGYRFCWMFKPPIVDAPKKLQSMLNEVGQHPMTEDVNVKTGKYYATVREMINEAINLGCDTVVNCTGLGSRDLCSDPTVVGARGVLLHFDRTCERMEKFASMANDAAILTEEPSWASETDNCYLIPRGDVIVVGGTYLEGDNEQSIRPEEKERIIKNAQLLGVDTDKSPSIGEWTGFRPYRPTTRLELEDRADVPNGFKVVHNYGHGGSGWTVFAGAAREVASLLDV